MIPSRCYGAFAGLILLAAAGTTGPGFAEDPAEPSTVITQPGYTPPAPIDPGQFRDNLGNHIATQTLAMGGFAIQNAGSVNATSLTATGNVTGNEFRATVYFHTSDRRAKTGITDLEGLGLVRQLHPVRYRFVDSGRPGMGFVAQEVAAVAPDIVAADPQTGMLAMDYSQIIAPLVAAVQELEARVAQLEAELAAERGQ
jgi:hypothetical protein